MDKRIINAVAGSGKTYYIIEKLNITDRIAVITYTKENQSLLKERVLDKFGYMPNNISIYGLFEFLFSFCLRPIHKPKLEGIIFDRPHFMNTNYYSGNRIYSNRISKCLMDNYKDEVRERIHKYFDVLYLDEIQDLASDEFDFLVFLSTLNINVLGVGDFYQRTFSSSNRGNKNNGILHNYNRYNNRLSESGFNVDLDELKKSRRCTETVCKFIRSKLEIEIYSMEDKESTIKFVEDKEEILQILKDDSVKKLFYQGYYKYSCNANNWGNSKGQTYENICVVLNKTTANLFIKDKLIEMAYQTKAKFYVACTRTKKNLYFIKEYDIPVEFISK